MNDKTLHRWFAVQLVEFLRARCKILDGQTAEKASEKKELPSVEPIALSREAATQGSTGAHRFAN